ncbi:MAG: glycosyltransferase family 2 protein [Candidatus Woesearchaeota archaeon]
MKISIIIPAYNEEKYISRCISTLLSQSYKNFELIIVDDGSTDRTISIVRKFMKEDKRIKLLSQSHGGPGRARNLGAKHAKGEILVFVDADMEFDKDYIKNLTKPIIEGKYVGTWHNKEYVANKDNVWASLWGLKRGVYKEGTKSQIYRAIRKKDFMKVGGFDPSKGYFDDSTIYDKLKIPSIAVNATCYHNNPTDLKEVFRQISWIGGSFATNSYYIKLYIKRHIKKVILLISILCIIFIFFIKFPYATPYVGLSLIITYLLFISLTLRNLKRIFFKPVFDIVYVSGFIFGAVRNLFKGKKIY